MNMVSESDLPRPVSGPVQNASAGQGAVGVAAACGAASRQLQPARERQEVLIRRRGWSGCRSMRSSFTTASAGPGAAGRADPEERLEWQQKVNIFKTTYSFVASTDSADQRFDA